MGKQKPWAIALMLATICLAAIPGQAFAFFSYHRASPPKAPLSASERVSVASLPGGSALMQIGSGYVGRTKGFGHRVPFSDALSLLLPSGWKPVTNKSTKEVTADFSWRPGHPWTEVLDRNGRKHHLRFVADWGARRLYVSRSSDEAADMVQSGHSTSGGASGGTTANVKSRESSWTLKVGGLRAQLLKWAKRAHWRVIWAVGHGVEDVQVQAGATLHGDFVDVAHRVVTSLGLTGAGYMGNSVLVVQER